MNKSTHFTGQPILSQLLNLIPRSRVNKIAREHQSDCYCKRFMTYDHLVSMLFCVLGNCTSLREVSLLQGAIITMDRGYQNYSMYNQWTKKNISFVTRLRAESVYAVEYTRQLSKEQRNQGVLSDQQIILGHDHQKHTTKVKARLIRYKDSDTEREFVFLTNNMEMNPNTIACIYKQRWQIETLFKRIKQNYPLRNFLGDNPNAIKIQIWCALIADLILKTIKKSSPQKMGLYKPLSDDSDTSDQLY